MTKPPRAELKVPDRPLSEQDHDVLVLPRKEVLGEWEYFRLPVTKTPQGSEKPGEFHKSPERWDLEDRGQRKVLNVAHPHHEASTQAAQQEARGPAFAALPIRPDPDAASFPTCFLINVEQLDVPNLWSIEEWDDGPGGQDLPTPDHPTGMEFLLALPQGRVLRLNLKDLASWPKGRIDVKTLGSDKIELTDVDLRYESELWSQLRNGTIAGRVTVGSNEQRKTLPMVNLTALLPGVASEALPDGVHRPDKTGVVNFGVGGKE